MLCAVVPAKFVSPLRMRLTFVALLCFLVATHAWRSRQHSSVHQKGKQTRIHRPFTPLRSSLRSVDISPGGDQSLLKTILRNGDMHKGKPGTKDTVEIAWKIRDQAGTLLHDSTVKTDGDVSGPTPQPAQNSTADAVYEVEVDEAFDFQVGVEPRQVILGWEHAVRTMHEGELASLIIAPHLAFGSKGAPPIVPPNTVLHCELELLSITPALNRRFKSVGVNESIHEELVEKLQSGESPVSAAVMHTDKRAAYKESAPITSDGVLTASADSADADGSAAKKAGEEARFFDPSKHKLDEKLRVQGTGAGHMWTETKYTMDVEVPLTALHSEGRRVSKADLQVTIRPDSVDVSLREGSPTTAGELAGSLSLLQGPLHGRVSAPDCSWALLEYSDVESFRRQAAQYVLLSLEKGFGSRDIWASVLQIEEAEAPNFAQ